MLKLNIISNVERIKTVSNTEADALDGCRRRVKHTHNRARAWECRSHGLHHDLWHCSAKIEYIIANDQRDNLIALLLTSSLQWSCVVSFYSRFKIQKLLYMFLFSQNYKKKKLSKICNNVNCYPIFPERVELKLVSNFCIIHFIQLLGSDIQLCINNFWMVIVWIDDHQNLT